MNRKDVIEVLEMENDLICFNPLTGEEIPLEFVNDLNKKCYYAHQEAIRLINNSISIEYIKKWADKFYKVVNGTRYYLGDGYDTVWDLLEDWEKENADNS